MSEQVTMVKNAIHNPGDARHFMRIAEPGHLVTAHLGEVELARSERVLKVKEVGFDIYDPVIYFPRADVALERLARTDKTTHCPLKGDTEYFDALVDDARVANVAWSYDRTIDRAAALTGYIAFDSALVQIVEYTASA